MSELRRILVVDDEEEIRRMLADLLDRPDWHVDLAQTGQEALDRILQQSYDVVISDILMPQVDGMDLLQRIAAVRPHMRVILITGAGSTERVKQAMRLGAYDYIEKPFDPQAFLEVVEAAMNAEVNGSILSPASTSNGCDVLTGLWTHRHFFEYLAYLRARCRRNNEPLGILVLDVDNFSEVNTLFGYAAGDDVLGEISRRLRRLIRDTDVAARYGSEEFIVALPQATTATALCVAERIRSTMAAEAIPVTDSDRRTITVSIGLAECETGFIEPEDDLVRRATEALRLAKAQGKNRCVAWQPRDPARADAPRPDMAGVQALTEQLEIINGQLKQTCLESTRALIAAVEAKDPYTEAHSMAVTLYAEAIGREMDLDGPLLQTIRTAALLHDIGKIGVPDQILTKPGKLDAAEWQVIKRHAQMGVQILEHASFLRAELPIILYHHEWFNGRGYPEGLSGEQIPLGARVLNAADAIDAMFSRRSYKDGYDSPRVIEELRKGTGTQFDPKVAGAAIRWLEAHPEDIIYPSMRHGSDKMALAAVR